jgi:hypothetical protein
MSELGRGQVPSPEWEDDEDWAALWAKPVVVRQRLARPAHERISRRRHPLAVRQFRTHARR